MDKMGILTAAAIIFLILPFSPAASDNKAPNPDQPSVEWKSRSFISGLDNCVYCDTDRDGYEEIFLYDIGHVMVLDPPSYKEVLCFDIGFTPFPGISMSIEDLGGNGHLQIVIYCRDGYSSNWTVYSGEDFSILWKSPERRIPNINNAFWDLHQIVDVNADGEKEFIWSSNDSNQSGVSASIQIYGGVSHELEWTSPAYRNPISSLLVNIDSDPALEILLFQQTLDYTWASTSMQVYDGSTHRLQWEIPWRDDVRFCLAPYYESPNGYYYPDIQDITNKDTGRSTIDYDVQDITNDGVKDIVVEHQQYENGNVTDSGISVYSGQDGTLEWNVTTTGVIPEYSIFIRTVKILDVDHDGIKELMVLTPNASGPSSNDTDIRLYSGVNGTLKWNFSVSGIFPIINAKDIDGNGDIELLITSGTETSADNSERAFDIIDVKDNKSLWRTGPVPCAGYSELYAQDINSDGKVELIIGNITVHQYKNGENTDTFVCNTFQVLGSQYNVVWTSPPTMTNSYINRMDLMKFDENSSPEFIISNFTWENGNHTNNTIRIFSMKDFQEIATLRFGNGQVKYHFEDIINDSRKELIVEVEPVLEDWGRTNGTLYIVNTSSFQMIWSSPGFEGINYRYVLFGMDMTGNAEREIVFEGMTWKRLEYTPYVTGEAWSNISIYDNSGHQLIWCSESFNIGQVIDVKDLDKDTNMELIVSTEVSPRRIIILQFPRDGLWTDTPDWNNLDNPPTIIAFSTPNETTVNASEKLTFSVDATDPEGDSLTYRWDEDGLTISPEPNFTRTFPPGDHTLTLTISDGYLSATRTINFKVNPSSKAPPPPEVAGSWPWAVTTITVFAGVAVALTSAAGTEVGKYRLTGLLFPLYTRLRKEELLDHETRGLLRGFIYAEPGVHFNEILRRLKLSNGTAAYHLMALEREGFIKSRSDGRLKRFYPAEMKLIDIPPRLGMVQGNILKTVQQSEGVSQREIARILEIPHSTVNRHVKKLVDFGLLRLVKEGVTTKCYLAEGQKASQIEGTTKEELHQ